MRKTKFQNENFYHIFNRGVDKRVVFEDKFDYFRFLSLAREVNTPEQIGSLYHLKERLKRSDSERFRRSKTPLVAITAYNLVNNHFHFLLKQLTEGGISKFMQKLSAGYTSYFNIKHQRSGSLFQGTYKSVKIMTDEQLLYVSAYINANAEIHGLGRAADWKYSSYLDYIDQRNGTLCDKKVILKEFNDTNSYKEYTNEVIKNSKSIKDEVRQYLLEL
jgi:putative transposase